MKYLITILLILFVAGAVSASDFTEGKGEKPKTELDKAKDGDKAKTVEGTDPAEKTTSAKLTPTLPTDLDEADSDSTYSSVNKYNFIFYFIYKHKYDSRGESLRNFLN